MITHYFRTLKDSELKSLASSRSGVWTHVVAPTEEELASLVTEFALDESIIEDSKDFFEVPRFERSQGVSYFFARYPSNKVKEDVDTAPLLIVMGETFVLTVAQMEVPSFAAFISGKQEIVTTQKTKLFLELVGAITRSFESRLVRTRRGVQKDRARLRAIGPREISRLVQHEHELNDLLAAVVPMNDWLRQVTQRNYFPMYDDDRELVEDITIANGQLIDSSRSILRTIQNVRSASEAILASNLNTTIKTLTVLTILLTIPTIVASLYGMNVPLPLMNHPQAFWLVAVFIAMAVSLVVWYFKRVNWL
ncbi:hypothetical protein N9L26_00440 [Candidatus Pacebacteria bacterium]|nr:hypothetical protein [Candidatus Paceibacterota bacterium]